MEVVPSRSYKLDVRPYPIHLDEVKKTMKHLRENHELYYLVYRLMLEGGLKLSHALHLIESYSPSEVVEVLGRVWRRRDSYVLRIGASAGTT